MASARASTEIPYRLAEGLSLEVPPVVLPWGADIDQLGKLGHPKKLDGFLSWSPANVFGNVEVEVSYRKSSPNVFWLTRSSKADNAQNEYQELRELLVRRFGTPHTDEIDDGYPWITWRYGDIRVSLRIGERFTEYVSFMVSKGL